MGEHILALTRGGITSRSRGPGGRRGPLDSRSGRAPAHKVTRPPHTVLAAGITLLTRGDGRPRRDALGLAPVRRWRVVPTLVAKECFRTPVLAVHLLGSLPLVLHDEDEGIAEALRCDAEFEANPSLACH